MGVRIWDLDAGQLIGPPLTGDHRSASALAFETRWLVIAAAAASGRLPPGKIGGTMCPAKSFPGAAGRHVSHRRLRAAMPRSGRPRQFGCLDHIQ